MTRATFLSAAAAGIAVAAILGDHELILVVVLYAACLALVWFTGIRALVLWARSLRPVPAVPRSEANLRVALLYCTADDFDRRALICSAAQDVQTAVFILDDSISVTGRRSVDQAARAIGATVLRRRERTGAKAGNINHALNLISAELDAIVVLDSDTRIPSDFVTRTTRILAADPAIACVQGVPVAGGPSRFARFFGPLVRSHARVNHATRARVGFPAFVGRGALLSTRALSAVGGFPEVVSEDLALSVRFREQGLRIVHAPDIEFAEDFPVDYAAFRVQQAKAAEGATEFLRETRLARKLRWRERADLHLETVLLPAGAAAGLGALASGSILALWEQPAPALLSAITGLLAVAPLLPEAVRRLAERRPQSAFAFLFAAPLLYASVSLLIVRHALAVGSGRPARFRVTPKRAVLLSPREAIQVLHVEFVWATVALVTGLCLGAPLLAVPFLMPAVVGLTLLISGRFRQERGDSRRTVDADAMRAPQTEPRSASAVPSA